MKSITSICFWSALTLTILGEFAYHFWLFDLINHFKLQFVIILEGLLLGLILVKWNSWKVIATMVLITFHASSMLDTLGIRIHKHRPLHSMMMMNLYSANPNPELAINYIDSCKADILILLEYTPDWNLRLNNLDSTYPYAHKEIRIDNFGIAIYSKNPMDCKTEFLGTRSDSYDQFLTPSIEATIKLNHDTLSLLAVHPPPPVGQAAFTARNRQIEDFGQWAKSQQNRHIIIGDLNCSSYSPHFKKMLKDGNLYDTRIGRGAQYSWPVGLPLLHTTIDHCLASKNVQSVKRHRGPDVGSDHYPIYINFY